MPLPLLALGGMALGSAVGAGAKGLMNYIKGKDEEKEARRRAIKGLYAQMGGPYSVMMGSDIPKAPSAFETIAMPVGQSIISGLGNMDEEDPLKAAGKGFAGGFG